MRQAAGRVRLVIELDGATTAQAESMASNIRRNIRTLLVPFTVTRADVCQVNDADNNEATIRRLTDMYNRERDERLHMARNPNCACFSCERIRQEAING